MSRRLSPFERLLLLIGCSVAVLALGLSLPFADARHAGIALLRALLLGGFASAITLGLGLGLMVWQERRAREEWHLRRVQLRARATYATQGSAPEATVVPAPPPAATDTPADTRTASPVAPGSAAVWTTGLLAALDWRRFEELCAGYFRLRGYRTEQRPPGSDGGIHIELYRPDTGDRLLGILLCRACGNGGCTGIRELRELYGMMTAEAAALGLYVSRGGYSAEAVAFAQGKPLRLLDPSGLVALLRKLPAEASAALYAEIVRDDYATPSCPQCGDKMLLRTLTSGPRAGTRFWGCRHYPDCRGLMPLRAENVTVAVPVHAFAEPGRPPRAAAS